MPPHSTSYPFQLLTRFFCQSCFEARSSVHTDYWNFVSRLHSGRAELVSLAEDGLISATCGKR